MIVIFYSSCWEDAFTSQGIPDKFIKGEVIIRAENNYPMGLIKISDVFSNDPYLESPSRAILYHYSELQIFDLWDTVYFKIKQDESLYYATDISEVSPSAGDIISKRGLYQIINKFNFNLHNSDPHREGPQHKIRHRQPGSNKGKAGQGIYVIEFVDPNSSFANEYYYIKTLTPNAVVPNTNYFLGLTNENAAGLDNHGFNITDATHVYDMSLTHDHTIE